MDPKQLFRWLHDFALENRVLTTSIAVSLIGGIPLYIYSLSIGQLPDFSLADFTGILIASFLTEIVIAATMVAYLLFAGLATRKVINGFYPEREHPSSKDANVGTSVAHNTRDYLFKGRFIVGVTIFSLLAWFGAVTKPFDTWLAPQYPGLAEWVYAISLLAIGLLVMVDWRWGLRAAKYALFAILTGSIAFLTVLATAYLTGAVAEPAGVQLPPASPSVSLQEVSTFVNDTSVLILRDNLVVTALIVAAVAATVALVAVYLTRKRRSAIKSDKTPKLFFKNEALKLLAAKILATVVFVFCTILVVLFFAMLIDAGSLHDQTLTALAGGSYLIMLNWLAFVTRDWKNRIILGFATFITVFILIPMESSNATLFPKMIVKALGVGNLHASSIALSSLQCATLAPYGVDCAANKDMGIGITNVNILNRLGSTVLIELQVRKTAESMPIKTQASPSSQASDALASSPKSVKYKTLAMPAGPTDEQTEKRLTAIYPCDQLLMERLNASDPSKARALACVRLSVPKEQVLGNTMNGFATYSGDFSQYIHAASASLTKGG